ncbi:energy-coupling factor transporter ATPase [Halothermothrix orenii]|uniref:Energy-coupling factor transporter ATP-binding protein EcfA2 n=1 Tax=Halothermothrix orenii (strain H 168 / OCM 544 / DSM 9562) TaxID=373903 RepID=B8D0U0_HALOH|nr:energy-coupling factor transporter ATPase [Halothermothrix orenii]ACL68909.1 ABC transporter related [Halothermothrix orenii H 168]ACL69004.1 ABC transporter related [Halothermothrix orenii H 168]
MLIQLKDVSHIYSGQNEKALESVNLRIQSNEFIGIVGHTGSGKSTLVQLFNGLIKPSEGKVFIEGIDIHQKKVSKREIRQKIGLVFQYPEHQLFEETIYDEVAFGPRNLDLSEEEIKKRVIQALSLVGMDYETYKDRSPFHLSGGQQRKIAIAGVLAMMPEVLILDEPTAGLDPRGREQLIKLLKQLHRDYKMTVILISHRMEEISQLSNRVLVLSRGRIVMDGKPEEVFTRVDEIRKLGLDLPQITEVLWELKNRGLRVRTDIFNVEEATREIITKMRESQC